jgi:hypothetical protein
MLPMIVNELDIMYVIWARDHNCIMLDNKSIDALNDSFKKVRKFFDEVDDFLSDNQLINELDQKYSNQL